MRNKPDPIMVEVLSALGDVELRERYLIDKSRPVRNWQHGEYCDGVVTINPAPHVVGILVHEMLHHIRPEWSERSVRRRTTQIVRKMTHEEAQAIYDQWLSRKS